MTSDLTKVDLLCEKNNAAHKTSEISKERLIVRRGQTFLLTLHFSCAQSQQTSDFLELIVQTGPKPSEDLGTECVFSVSRKSRAKKSWDVKVRETSATCVTLAITSPADASIGEYTLSVRTHPNMNQGHRAGAFVLLFNPWCAEDWVYLASEEERQEYVLSEDGLIYRGSTYYITDLAWDFGQFEDDILDICLKILDLNPKCQRNAAEDFSARCNPIYVSRVISAMINSNDDRGVLQGNWSSSFRGGVPPTHWSGSLDILRTWKKSDYHPVKYGQCWVFAGVMCTVLRCLGIPCRVVSNFLSAHDTHGNLLIDVYYSEDGMEPKESHDSIWNYHVWTEGWMRRPDLPREPLYDGWQVVDPTPQELSGGVFCCGPAPVKAVHEGHTDLKYDLPFVFAEVNADRVTWKILANGSKRRIKTEKAYVGQNISTKSVGGDERLDITANYKYREGTRKERQAFKKAVRRCDDVDEPEQEPAQEQDPSDMSIKIKERSKPINGTDLDLVIRLQSPTRRVLVLHVKAQVMQYNGVCESEVSCTKQRVKLLPDEVVMVPFQIPFAKYGSHIQGNNSIKVTAVANDKEQAEALYLAERDIVLQNPPLCITIIGNPVHFMKLQAEVNFNNPLPEALTNCSITVSGSGLLKEPVVTRFSCVGPGQEARAVVVFRPYRFGCKKLMANLNCDQFQNIQTSCKIKVKCVLTSLFEC